MPTQPKHHDDNLMERFDRAGARRFSARQAIVSVFITAAILVISAGASIRKAGHETRSGIGRTAVLAVGNPAGWIADQVPAHRAAHFLTAWLSPDVNLGGPGGFSQPVSLTTATGGVPQVTPDAFAPAELGIAPPPRRPLRRLLVTGDSMSQPLDQDLAQKLTPQGLTVTRDPHIGTAISNTVLVDWGKLAQHQVAQYHPDAVVVFIGANDGYSMPGPTGGQVNCCTAAWAAVYANRVRLMMNTYRQNGAARVYWLTLPTPRDNARAKIARVVNAAIDVAAQPWRNQVRVIDTVAVFTPGERYRDSMSVNGQPTIVRQSDGIHLNDAGASLAATIVLNAIGQDFTH